MSDAPPEPSRVERRKARTRAALVDAAARMLAAGDHEGVSIERITAAADVGHGSFYNHFSSKDELFEAAVHETMQRYAELLAEVSAGLDEPGELIAVRVRVGGQIRSRFPQVGRVMAKNGFKYMFANRGLAPGVRQALRDGMDSGRFRIQDPDIALTTMSGAFIGLMHLLDAQTERDAQAAFDTLAVDLLIMLGLEPTEARELVEKPLPVLPRP